jgi:hypothetical protein
MVLLLFSFELFNETYTATPATRDLGNDHFDGISAGELRQDRGGPVGKGEYGRKMDKVEHGVRYDTGQTQKNRRWMEMNGGKTLSW